MALPLHSKATGCPALIGFMPLPAQRTPSCGHFKWCAGGLTGGGASAVLTISGRMAAAGAIAIEQSPVPERVSVLSRHGVAGGGRLENPLA